MATLNDFNARIGALARAVGRDHALLSNRTPVTKYKDVTALTRGTTLTHNMNTTNIAFKAYNSDGSVNKYVSVTPSGANTVTVGYDHPNATATFTGRIVLTFAPNTTTVIP